MPSCDKELRIYDRRMTDKDAKVVLVLKCVCGSLHSGDHQFHIWVDGYNAATGKPGHIATVTAK